MPYVPIVVSSDEWSRITRWTSDCEDQDAARRRAYVKKLDDESREMRKDWPNSVENVNKRLEEQRQARIRGSEEANMEFYRSYVKRQQDEAKRMMRSARDIIFKNKDAPKMLLSAVLETVVQKERQEQTKFLNKCRSEEAEQKRRDDDDIIAKAEEWHQQRKIKKERRFQVNKEHQKEILEQAREVYERNRKEHEDELTLQKQDHVKAQDEMDQIEKFEKDFRAQTKARIWSDMERSRMETETRRREQKARSDMDDQLIDVIVNSRRRIDCKRKETERMLQEERLLILDAISKKLESGDAAREMKEQQILDKAVKEHENINAMKEEAEKKKIERLKAERVEARKQYLQDEEKRQKQELSMRNYELMNRFKNNEINEKYKQQLRDERQRKIDQHREYLLKQWKERDDEEARVLAETRMFYGQLTTEGFRRNDRKVLAHAEMLLEEAKQHGRPDYALKKAIHKYCKLNSLYRTRHLPKSLRNIFPKYAPKDGTQFDEDDESEQTPDAEQTNETTSEKKKEEK